MRDPFTTGVRCGVLLAALVAGAWCEAAFMPGPWRWLGLGSAICLSVSLLAFLIRGRPV